MVKLIALWIGLVIGNFFWQKLGILEPTNYGAACERSYFEAVALLLAYLALYEDLKEKT